MNLSWLDRFVIFWYGIKQPYDEHARAVVGRISTGALLIVVMVEFCILMAEAILNLHWLNSVALIVLFVAIIWVGLAIKDAGLTQIETTAFNYHRTLNRLKWDSVRYAMVFIIAFAGTMVLTSLSSGSLQHAWSVKVLLMVLLGIVCGIGTYFQDKKNIRIIPEDE
ncbi:DUF3278 domain-containing protein [Lacticaseibacillus zhaodongensis]|uniref:DUF3278 domain-containing protein n=1 Tax=Lacticaseibacillus zhaodongensis TaxID=2668065 RepID=UPI0012D32A65|nr:DUF3278 domain-containing protein [Lacticaseibacillus zhaodongensis]